MPFTRLCPQCSAPVKIKIGKCVCGHSFRELRKEHDRASMAKKRVLEPESEALLRKKQNRVSMASKRESLGYLTGNCNCKFSFKGQVWS